MKHTAAFLKLQTMIQEEKITRGLDKVLMQLIDAEMNDPVLGKLLNRNAAYVLGKEIKLVLIERACQWLQKQNNIERYVNPIGYGRMLDKGKLIDDFKKAM